jgi:hypothetical protein
MTISKKLSIAITLALGIQFSAGAFCHDEEFYHHKDKKCTEEALICNFAQNLRNQNSIKAQEIATWLESKATREYGSRNGISYDVKSYPESIVNIITNHGLTEKAKIGLLSTIIAQEKRDKRKQAIWGCVDAVCAGVICLGAAALMTWAIVEDIKNPRPRIYVQPTPRVTITYKTSSYSPQVTCYEYWYL